MEKARFEALYRQMLPSLYRLAQSMLLCEADAQDAVQQAAIKAWQARDRISPLSEKAYLTRIVINECRNIQRNRRKVTPMEEMPERACPDDNRELKLAIDSLNETLRLPLLMRYMEGYSERETAAALNISVAALKGRLFKARRQLAKALKEEVEFI